MSTSVAAAAGEDLFLLAALGIPMSLILIFVIYLISTGRWDDVKRIGPLLSVPGVVTGAAVVFRAYYQSEWGQYLSNAMILIAYAIGLYLIIREFNLARRRVSRAGLEGADD
jgi:hypothetical protein